MRRSRSPSACARAFAARSASPCSAGVATVKMVAKIASDANKPDGLTVVPPGTERDFLAPLRVGQLWGIGPKTLPRVEAAGVRTIGDVAQLDDAACYRIFGRGGTFYRDLARGIDERELSTRRASANRSRAKRPSSTTCATKGASSRCCASSRPS